LLNHISYLLSIVLCYHLDRKLLPVTATLPKDRMPTDYRRARASSQQREQWLVHKQCMLMESSIICVVAGPAALNNSQQMLRQSALTAVEVMEPSP
jgi:hypothetical protein